MNSLDVDCDSTKSHWKWQISIINFEVNERNKKRDSEEQRENVNSSNFLKYLQDFLVFEKVLCFLIGLC